MLSLLKKFWNKLTYKENKEDLSILGSIAILGSGVAALMAAGYVILFILGSVLLTGLKAADECDANNCFNKAVANIETSYEGWRQDIEKHKRDK